MFISDLLGCLPLDKASNTFLKILTDLLALLRVNCLERCLPNSCIFKFLDILSNSRLDGIPLKSEKVISHFSAITLSLLSSSFIEWQKTTSENILLLKIVFITALPKPLLSISHFDISN